MSSFCYWKGEMIWLWVAKTWNCIRKREKGSAVTTAIQVQANAEEKSRKWKQFYRAITNRFATAEEAMLGWMRVVRSDGRFSRCTSTYTWLNNGSSRKDYSAGNNTRSAARPGPSRPHYVLVSAEFMTPPSATLGKRLKGIFVPNVQLYPMSIARQYFSRFRGYSLTHSRLKQTM